MNVSPVLFCSWFAWRFQFKSKKIKSEGKESGGGNEFRVLEETNNKISYMIKVWLCWSVCMKNLWNILSLHAYLVGTSSIFTKEYIQPSPNEYDS